MLIYCLPKLFDWFACLYVNNSRLHCFEPLERAHEQIATEVTHTHTRHSSWYSYPGGIRQLEKITHRKKIDKTYFNANSYARWANRMQQHNKRRDRHRNKSYKIDILTYVSELLLPFAFLPMLVETANKATQFQRTSCAGITLQDFSKHLKKNPFVTCILSGKSEAFEAVYTYEADVKFS